MPEKKEGVPELTGLARRSSADENAEYYVPDYVIRDFGETEETSYPSGGASGRRSDGGFLL